MNQKNLNQYSLSKISGIPSATLNDLLCGRSNILNCSTKTTKALAEALKCTMEEIVNLSFIKTFPNASEYIDKNDYYKEMLDGRKNIILAFESALEFYKLANRSAGNQIFVYSYKSLPEPFSFEKVDNFKNIQYENIDGLLVTTLSQTINDMLSFKNRDTQSLYEALTTYYYENNHDFSTINITNENKKIFKKRCKESLEYYDE